MPSPAASSSSVAPASPLSVKRPALSPRKRKLSDASSSASEAASPTSLDEVVGATGSPLEERVISPKKKARAEERASSSSSSSGGGGNLSKWESRVVASIASALDLDGSDDKQSSSSASSCMEPIAFWAAPAGDLAADELQILRHFLA